MTRPLSALVALFLTLGATAGNATAQPGPPAPPVPEELADAGSVAGLVAAARRLPRGGRLFVSALELSGDETAAALELERIEVFTPRARIVVHGAGGDTTRPVPRDNAYFRGTVAGEPDSLAVLSVRRSGEVRGVVRRDGGVWVLGGGPGERGAALAAHRPETTAATSLDGFACAEDELPAPPPRPAMLGSSVTASFTSTAYTARVAVESDWELFQRFGSVAAATDYVADLFAYASAIYDQEIATDLQVSYLSLWTTSADPWQQTSTSCGLYEFGRYWNDNRGAVERTIAHFLSGKNNGGGIAWVGVLCEGSFNVNLGTSCPGLSPSIDNYGGAYGYTGDLDGNFDIDDPQVVWDVVAVTHEIGHNFDSPHTHCYNGLGGSTSPVDECYSGEPGCYSGATSLPSGCPGAGAGCGTIMSYCHLRSGSFGNISLNFGTDHPYGVLPQRVPDRMRTHVESIAGFAPACLARVSACHALTLSHTGSGSDPVAVPAASAGCTAGSYLAGEAIALTAGAAAGWSVGGWTGTDDDASTSYVNTLTMPAVDHAAAVQYADGCDDLVLDTGTDTGTVVYDTCGTLTAGGGYGVAAPGDVTLRAGKTVVLTDGFHVGAGARLTIDAGP